MDASHQEFPASNSTETIITRAQEAATLFSQVYNLYPTTADALLHSSFISPKEADPYHDLAAQIVVNAHSSNLEKSRTTLDNIESLEFNPFDPTQLIDRLATLNDMFSSTNPLDLKLLVENQILKLQNILLNETHKPNIKETFTQALTHVEDFPQPTKSVLRRYKHLDDASKELASHINFPTSTS